MDGELFDVFPTSNDGRSFEYDWVSGRNRGYGFSSTANTDGFFPDEDARHATSIKAFLAQIDPTTGFISDDEHEDD